MANEPEVKDQILAVLKEHTGELSKQIAKANDEIKQTGAIAKETGEAIEKLGAKNAELQARLGEIEQKLVQPPGPGSKAEKSLGKRFTESDEIKDFVKRNAKGSSGRFAVKNITEASGSAGAGVYSDRLQGVVEDPLRPVAIRALLDKGTTGSNLIEWIRENVFTNNANVVSEGATKPQSEITYERVDVPVRTLAHWVKASKQVLADFPQLQTLIDGRLTLGLKIKEDTELLSGDGTGEHILGLVPQATVYNTGLNVSGDTQIDVLRHAILQVWQSFYPATGIVLNPADWEKIELLKDTQKRYLFGYPGQSVMPTLWGLPVAQSFALGEGEFLVGSFRLAATLFDREDAGIYVSTEDGDNFVRNMVTVLAEERLALAVSRPKSFVHGSFPG